MLSRHEHEQTGGEPWGGGGEAGGTA
jgi:hypothetical protein